MSLPFRQKVTVTQIICWMAVLAIIGTSLIMINSNSTGLGLQGWVNLLFLPIPIVILIIDRICTRKFGDKKVNKIEFYILGGLFLLFVLNVFRMRMQIYNL